MTPISQNPSGRPSRRVALVTGANKGIGLETSRRLAQEGLLVVLGARDAERGAEAAGALRREGLEVEVARLDLADPASIPTVAADFADRFGRLDVLVNNAGIAHGDDGPPETADLEAVRKTFETNVLGTLAVVQAFLPLLKASKSGRIVVVSTELASLTRNGDPDWAFAGHRLFGYGASKAALNMMTVQLAAQLKPFGILVNSADPGFTATDLNGRRGIQTVEQGARASVRLALLPDGAPTGGFLGADGELPW